MRFIKFINEKLDPSWGYGITFIDIDETTFKTFAKIQVVKDGKVIRELDNQEFNSYKLKDGESFDFHQFKDADLFFKTSIPIPKTINMIKNMIKNIDEKGRGSKIVFLTARGDFDNKERFLQTFEKYGIKMDKPTVYVERTGNMKSGTVDGNKKKVMMEYIKTGLYRRVRLIDDHLPNLKALKDIEENLPVEIEDKVRKTYDLGPDVEHPIQFFALHVDESGTLHRVN